MKLLLRLLFKTITTPIVAPAMLGMIIIGYGFLFIDWLYDYPDKLDHEMNQEMLAEFIRDFKRWFTTI